MNHNELVSAANKILKEKFGCSVIVSEQKSLSREIPDAIGWRGDVSIVIECKTSRADFFADAEKPFRKIGGAGKWRFYLAPYGILSDSDIPDGWRLLQIDGDVVTGLPIGNCWYGSESFNKRDAETELNILLAYIRNQLMNVSG